MDDTLRAKIRDVFEEGWHCGASGVEALAESWGNSEALGYARELVPLPAALFTGGATARLGDLVVLVSSDHTQSRREIERFGERLAAFGDSVGVRFVLLHGVELEAVVSKLRDRLAECAEQSRDPGDMVDRVLALLTGRRVDETSSASGG